MKEQISREERLQYLRDLRDGKNPTRPVDLRFMDSMASVNKLIVLMAEYAGITVGDDIDDVILDWEPIHDQRMASLSPGERNEFHRRWEEIIDQHYRPFKKKQP